MKLENLKAALGKDITAEEVAKLLEENGYDVAKKVAPATPDIADIVKAAVEAANRPLNEKIEALEKLMDKKPGDGMNLPKSEGDPATETDPREKPREELEAEETFARAHRSMQRQ
jgi:hypothetical protein